MTLEGPDVAASDPDDALPASWRAARDLPGLVLVESSAQLPGLLSPTGWMAVRDAAVVLAVDPGTHPLARALDRVGVDVEVLEPDDAGPVLGRDLLAAAPTGNDALARAGLQAARDRGRVALLLPPDDTQLARDIGITAAHDADVEIEWVFLEGAPRGLELVRLVAVMDRLLDPQDGCPWDLEQTHDSLAPHLVEETWEALDAIAAGDDAAIAEELGDVLLQVIFHARIAQGRGAFDADTIAAGIADKLRRRHPHVFGDTEVEDADEVIDNWERIKAAEKPDRTGPFDGIVRAQPSLPLADAILRRAERVGYAPSATAAGDLVLGAATELATLLDDHPDDHGGDPALAAAVDEALGDLGLALVLAARSAGRDAEVAVRAATGALVDRFTAALRRAGDDRPTTSPLWQDLLDEVRAAGF